MFDCFMHNPKRNILHTCCHKAYINIIFICKRQYEIHLLNDGWPTHSGHAISPNTTLLTNIAVTPCT